jgi:hypothetical protein
MKPVPENWSVPKSERCVYEKQVNGGPLVRCRYRARDGEHGVITIRGYCGIHLRMVKGRREAERVRRS